MIVYLSKEYGSIHPGNCFIYEQLIYSREESTCISLLDKKLFKSNKFIEPKVIAPKKAKVFKYLDLLVAPEQWLQNNGFTPIEENELIKKKFRKK